MFHSKIFPRSKGFTLIELLVVLSIIAVLSSFVAPYTMQTLRSTETRSELIAFEKLVKKWHFDAFYQGGKVDMVFFEQFVEVYRGQQLLERVSFKHLSFPEQYLTVTTALKSRDVLIDIVLRDNPDTLRITVG